MRRGTELAQKLYCISIFLIVISMIAQLIVSMFFPEYTGLQSSVTKVFALTSITLMLAGFFSAMHYKDV